MQLLIFYGYKQQFVFLLMMSALNPLRVVGSNGSILTIWLFLNQVVLTIFRTLSLAGGGLKWTRTIDLTLIRRVL